MAYKEFTAGQEALAADVNSLYMQQVVARFPTAAARTAAIPSPVTNQLSMIDTRCVLQYWNSAAWVDLATGESPTGGARRIFSRYAATTTNATGDISLSWGTGLFTLLPESVMLTNATAGTALHFAINPNTLTVSGVQFRVFTAAGAQFASAAVNFYYSVSGVAA